MNFVEIIIIIYIYIVENLSFTNDEQKKNTKKNETFQYQVLPVICYTYFVNKRKVVSKTIINEIVQDEKQSYFYSTTK